MVEIFYEDITKLYKEEEVVELVVNKVFEVEEIRKEIIAYVTLTNNEKIKEINNEHRKINSATDVLSFPMYDKSEIINLKIGKPCGIQEEILGDIIVSIEKAKEQAEEYGHSFKRELAYLVTHGMLHLLGYDHIDKEEQEEMRKREEEILGYLKILRM